MYSQSRSRNKAGSKERKKPKYAANASVEKMDKYLDEKARNFERLQKEVCVV